MFLKLVMCFHLRFTEHRVIEYIIFVEFPLCYICILSWFHIQQHKCQRIINHTKNKQITTKMILRKLKNSVFLGHFLNDILIIHSDWSVKKPILCWCMPIPYESCRTFCLLYCPSVTMVCAISHGDHHSLIYTIIFFFKFEN